MPKHVKVTLFVRHWYPISDDECASTTDVCVRHAPLEGYNAWEREFIEELVEAELEAAMCGNEREHLEIVAVAEDWDFSPTLIYGHSTPLADIVRQLYDL